MEGWQETKKIRGPRVTCPQGLPFPFHPGGGHSSPGFLLHLITSCLALKWARAAPTPSSSPGLLYGRHHGEGLLSGATHLSGLPLKVRLLGLTPSETPLFPKLRTHPQSRLSSLITSVVSLTRLSPGCQMWDHSPVAHISLALGSKPPAPLSPVKTLAPEDPLGAWSAPPELQG